jgi:ferric-dicitrate binding protein FerR (iron transport regulator)
MRKDHATELGSTTSVTQQASHWWVLLNSGAATPAEHQAFGEWVARSPERVEAFLQTVRLSQALRSDKTRWPNTPVEDLIRAAKAAPAEVSHLPLTLQIDTPVAPAEGKVHKSVPLRAPGERGDSGGAGFRFLMPRLVVAVAMTLAVLAGASYFLWSPQRYQTALGEQRSVVLSDDSVVTLNTSTSIEVRMAKDRRTVTLLSGEALFQVAHDASRPFDVKTGDTTIRAVGTQFDVDRRAADTTVTVVEGKVAVFTAPGSSNDAEADNLPLAAGEQLTVAARSKSHRIRANVAAATAWTQRKLVFENRPLGEVAEEFNRYNRQRIDIRSPELRSQEVTGVFQANDPDSFMMFLAKIPDVNIERSADNQRFLVTLYDQTSASK